MIPKLLVSFLILIAINNVSSWNKCQQTFCGTLRNSPDGIDQKYYLIGSPQQENNTLIANLKTDQPEDAPQLQLRLTIYEHEIIHLLIDEAGRTSSKRFRPSVALVSDQLVHSNLTVGDTDTSIGVKAKNIKLDIIKNPFHIKIYDGVRLVSEINPKQNFVFQTKDTKEIAMGISLRDVHRAYGLPEHAERLPLKSTKNNGEPYRHFNVDYGHYQLESRESLYATIGVLYGHGPKYSSGIFWLNSAQTWIDTEIGPNYVDAFFMSESGIVDMFVLLGPTLPDTTKQYTKLTGTAPLPQYFTLGYHQSRYSYMTQEEVLDVVSKFDANEMPIDVMWLDIDYTEEKKYFTWDPKRFPNPQQLIDALKNSTRKLVAIIDPHIKVDDNYHVHTNATKNNYYVKTSDGIKDFQGQCWPGLSSYLDFLNDQARSYYSSLYTDHYFQNEIVHLWNDMNEPSVFEANNDENTIPASAIHSGGWEHRDVHNIYGLYQTIGTKEGLLKRDPKRRPFILTRSHFAGIQRYAAMWTGDNAATWEYLQISFPMCLTEALAGVSFCGADVAGFFDIPEDELYQRWYQAGAWLPFYRGHSGADVPRREPYLFGDTIRNRVFKALYQRYAHMPMWYTVFYEHEVTGEPVIRPITYHYPQEEDALSIDNQILLGTSILAAPVLEKQVLQTLVYLPGGENQLWFNIDDNYKSFRGIGYQSIDVTLDSVPVFYKAGSIISRKDQMQPSSEKTHKDPFTLYVCIDDNGLAEGKLYVDDYQSFDYKTGKYLYVNFKFNSSILYSENIQNTTYDTETFISEIVFINSKVHIHSAVLSNETSSEEFNATFTEDNNITIMNNFTLSLNSQFKIELAVSSSTVIHLSVIPIIVLFLSVMFNY